MKTLVLLFVASLFLSACNWGNFGRQKQEIYTDTLAYKYDTIKYRASDCGNKPDSTCSVAMIVYPEFSGQKALNDTIAKKLMLAGFNNPDKKPDSSLREFADNFIKGYMKDNPKKYSPSMFYTLDLKAGLLRQDSGLTTLQVGGYIYSGGAHGNSSTTFVNWDTKVRRNIALKDILTDGYQAKLAAIAETIFRKQEKLSDTSSLARDYFFKDNKFALNDNYSITPLGLRFLYNPYEIKPYAAGTTDLFIPYKNIQLLLRPNTVVSQYIK